MSRIAAVPKILEVVCRATGMGFAAVARVTDERWIACAVRDLIDFGLQPGGELDVATTICGEVRARGDRIVFDDVNAHPEFCGHPSPARYGFRSFISLPIFRGDGSFFGTLCAIDPKPARVDNEQTVEMFRLFAELIAMHLDSQDELAASNAALTDERETAELREQFIAVLGHDLRNPLGSIDAATRVLRAAATDARSRTMLDMAQSSVRRMAGLIGHVLDFARARLGGGLALDRKNETELAATLQHVIAELRTTSPNHPIEANIDLPEPVYCDRERIGQVLSNLLANALTHGAPQRPVEVEAKIDGGSFELLVANAGEPIPQAKLERLFQPFTRATAEPNQQGLGLGLYIAAQIARAHGGTLDVTSDAERTQFTFRMPAVGP